MKAFCRQRIQESNCARKETVNINIPVTHTNGDREIMQSIRKTKTSLKTSTKVIAVDKT